MSPTDFARKSLGGLPQPPHVLAAAHGVPTCSLARDPRNRSIWDDVPINIFDGNAKTQWMDDAAGWCHLCGEAFGCPVSVHVSDRDHVNIGLFVYQLAAYPRRWQSESVIRSAHAAFPTLARHAVGDPFSQEHLHCTEDEARRVELHSVLKALAHPPHSVLRGALQNNAALNIWVSGERMYKVHMSRLITTMAPPMAPGVASQFTHKCWGRSNLERVYEGIRIAQLKTECFGVEPKTTKDGRAYWMRLLFWELMTALDNREHGAGDATAILLENALRRLAFELTHHMSMFYMNRAQEAWIRLGRPTVDDLRELNSL